MFSVLVGKPVGRRTLVISRHRWGDNIRINLKEKIRGYIDLVDQLEGKNKRESVVKKFMKRRFL